MTLKISRRGLIKSAGLAASALTMPETSMALLRGSRSRINPNVGYTLTFVDDFDGPLSVSSNGPGTTWQFNKPGGGNFGAVGFGDVFSTSGGLLTIQAKKVGGIWHAGLLAAFTDAKDGFAQKFGYFEMRAQFPSAVGSNWPAFWLLAKNHITSDGVIPDVEIDVIEQFGDFNPNRFNYTYHYWTTPASSHDFGDGVDVGSMSDTFHTYGLSIEDDFTIWYFDRSEIYRMATYPEAKTELYPIIDLALSGTPPNYNPATPDPVSMLVDYVKVWQKN